MCTLERMGMQPPSGETSSLGAAVRPGGVDFRVASRSAERVELCLFDDADAPHERERVELARDGDSFLGRVDGLGPGAVYGLRAHGPFAPQRGQLHNPQKLLLDPYARRIVGSRFWHPTQQGSIYDDAGRPKGPDPRDSAPFSPRAVVVDPGFDWAEDARPRIPWSDTVLYECHVRGMTMAHPDVPAPRRGTFLGLCSAPIIAHLQRLGVTTLSLMPVQERYVDRRLTLLGLDNYWGYGTLGHLAPRADFASEAGQEVREIKTMVRELHAAGIEVLLDVVLNHGAEGDHLGPTLSLRGLDNLAYYRAHPADASRYENFSGCGNSLNVDDPLCLELALETFRRWSREVHVDGFRLDLAVSLARHRGSFDPRAPLLRAIQEDSTLAGLKWVAEPWDLGPDGYRLGEFPQPFFEWNDRYRDDVRRFVRGDPRARADLATRLAGSSDRFRSHGASKSRSINFSACHDGFTLWDSVSYAQKHNQENGEQGRDGRDENLSANWGVEGATDDPNVLELRARLVRMHLLLLCCSRGVPMLGHGDELGRSQRGNNNGYCHDSELTWLSWEDRASLLPFAAAAFALRRRHPALRDLRFVPPPEPDARACAWCWLRADGRPMEHGDWLEPEPATLGLMVNRQADSALAPDVDALLILVNAGDRPASFVLPDAPAPGRWCVVLDASSSGPADTARVPVDGVLSLVSHSAVVLERGSPGAGPA